MLQKISAIVTLLILAAPALSWASNPWDSFSQRDLVAMGGRIYNTRGANTCLMCHGSMGGGGSIQEAPRLDQPREWDIFHALGGESALSKNRQKILDDMQTVHKAMIEYGTIRWNRERDQIHPQVKLNFTLTDDPHGQLDPLMYGINQASTLKNIAKIRKELKKGKGLKLSKEEMKKLAVHSVYQYVKTFDKGGKRGGIFAQDAAN